MSGKSIKCFAVDHRSIDGGWPYPYIRLGTGFTNNCALKDTVGESICTERFNSFLGEWTAMWWLWKHLPDFGKTDFVGMTQYRRYFTSLAPNYGVFPIHHFTGEPTQQILDSILTPEQLLNAIEQYDADGILPARFPDYSYCNNCRDVVDLMLEESNWLKLGMSYSLCQKIFQSLKEFCKDKYEDEIIEASFKELNTFHFNMFVLREDLLDEYSQAVDHVVMETVKHIDDTKIEGLHKRLFGYVIERLSSCIFIMMALGKKAKFIECPILLLDKVEMKS